MRREPCHPGRAALGSSKTHSAAAGRGIVIAWLSHAGYLALFFGMLLESAAVPLPSEVILPFGGYLVSQGRLDLVGAVAAGVAGGLVGSLVLYAVGRFGGRPFLERYGRYVALRPHHLEAADRFFARYGEASVFVGRLLPVVRTYISLPAGIGRMRPVPFLMYSLLGSVPWTIALVLVGRALGSRWRDLGPFLHDAYLVLAAGIVVGVLGWVGLRRLRAGAR
jgi:membrane protein DedA with SNARE-associated domain